MLDGDTLDLDVCGAGERVRLLGLQAPELRGEDGRPECWAEEARDALARAVEGRSVRLSFDADCTDPWGRSLAYVWLEDDLGGLRGEPLAEELAAGGHLLVNEWMAAAGHAVVFGPERFGVLIWQSRLETAQARAESRREGSWGACLSPRG